MAEQIPFGSDDFANNPERRCPCILLLDVSASMQGEPIDEVNAGLATFKKEVMADSLAAKRVEVAIVTFGGVVQTVGDFTTISNFRPPTLTTNGDTPMGTAIHQAIEILRDRKNQYRANGIGYYRPWIFLITDGVPTDEWKISADHVKTGEANKSFLFFAVGTKEANFDVLKQVSVRPPLQMTGLRFKEFFKWLSESLKAVSRSKPGDSVPLPSPASWASVPS